MRKYVIESHYQIGDVCKLPKEPSYDFDEDYSGVIAKAAAAARLKYILRDEIWPKIYEKVDVELLEDIYLHQPHCIRFVLSDKNAKQKRKLHFYVDILGIKGRHEDTAGKFVCRIMIDKIRVTYNCISIMEFSPLASHLNWKFFR